MSEIRHEPDGREYVEFDGERRYLAARMPTAEEADDPTRPKYRAGRVILPREEWKDTSLKLWIPGIYDQNGQSSCTGNGVAAAFGAAYALTGAKPVRFSAGFIYAQVRDLLTAGKRYGFAPESVVPSRTIFKSQIPKSAYDEAMPYKIGEDWQADSFDEMGDAVERGFAVPFGVCLGRNFKCDAEGYVEDYSGHFEGGHCMYAFGKHKARGRWWLDVANSWGLRFGVQGICHMPESYFWKQKGQYVNLDAFVIRAVAPNAIDTPPKVLV